ncbi:hypothetical protein H7F15_19080 [Pontibacter sp. Tf4]|uniref:hypothetical protein n=1 Tax=Pontibacter sp. Tf4 TaxID=2761620 RepID=UPI0016293BC1|nr:hypothetical protein [Pontibacter sp. Tf4]MBB6613151.1 hypothetical protein [Pontibacter sp. Tf4]
MKHFVLLLIVLVCLASCSKTETHQINGVEYAVTPVDSSSNYLVESPSFSGVIFDKQKRPHTDVFTLRMLVRPTQEEKVTAFTPSLEEVIEAEKILKRCVEVDKIGADSMEIWEGAIRELPLYRRQYFGAINGKGQKLIWINCFSKKTDFMRFDWRTKVVSVDDGGDWFFNIVTNIDTHECYGFFRNSIGG